MTDTDTPRIAELRHRAGFDAESWDAFVADIASHLTLRGDRRRRASECLSGVLVSHPGTDRRTLRAIAEAWLVFAEHAQRAARRTRYPAHGSEAWYAARTIGERRWWLVVETSGSAAIDEGFGISGSPELRARLPRRIHHSYVRYVRDGEHGADAPNRVADRALTMLGDHSGPIRGAAAIGTFPVSAYGLQRLDALCAGLRITPLWPGEGVPR